MLNTLIAVAAFAATALAQGTTPGWAHVINSCDYPVYLANTPAENGGYSADTQTLSANGGTWDQQWTELSNAQGWSIKLSKNEGQFGDNIMQYEYTFHNDGYIWYDLSDVNGNPWDGNWEITAEGDSCEAGVKCSPRQAAYQYSTDDAYGMQACNQTASVTVELCSGDIASGSGSSSSSSAAPSSTAASSTYVAPSSSYVAPSSTAASTTAAPSTTAVPTSAPASTYSHHHWSASWGHEAVASVATTLATSAITSSAPAAVASEDSNNDVVIVVTTEIAYTTVDYPAPTKRAEAAHKHHQHHAARHPHAR